MFTSVIFILWGIIKIYVAIYETNLFSMPDIYYLETLFSNLLFAIIFVFHSVSMRTELDETQERYKLIVENAQDAFFYISLKPVIAFRYMTPSISKITGYNPQAFYSDFNTILNLAYTDSLDTFIKLFVTDTTSSFPTTEVCQIVKRNGDVIWVELCGQLIEADGEIVGVEGYIRDINQVKTAQDELIESKKSKELMFSYVSHELKTPITLVLGYATALKDGTQDPDTAIDVFNSESLVLERMIQDLSMLSQLETNQFSFNFEYMDCGELADTIYKSVFAELKNQTIPYSIKVDPETMADVSVIADPIRICQVCINLITNAVKYTRPKNHITININVNEDNSQFIIKVSDKGLGIRQEDLPHIFEAFYKPQRAEAHKVQGRGLGLALSKEIIAAHNGDIGVKSKLGKGSTFTVSLPTQY